MAEPRQFHHLLARVSRLDLRANWVHLARRAIHVTGFKGVVFAVIPARHTSCFAHTRRCLMRSPRSPIDDAWLQGALADTDALLRDHAHAERKAAATAMGLVAQYADIPELVEAMTALAIEELGHFQEVFQQLNRRGIALGSDPGDPYAKTLLAEVKGTREVKLVDRLLVGALIEARSCRRLALLGKHHRDDELAAMWTEMARAEAAHGPLFLELARKLGPSPEAVNARLAELEALESKLIDEGPVRAAVH